MKSSVLAAATSLLATASAHGGIDYYIAGGTTFQGWLPYQSVAGQKSLQREYPGYNPLMIPDLGSVNIRCNNAGSLGTGVTGTVVAGTNITAHWKQWTHRPAAFTVYMAKCPSTGCDSWAGAGQGWFKVYQQGLISGTEGKGIWAGDAILDTLQATHPVPATLAPGNYLIRHEVIALHQANNPQFYPECSQWTVTGAGTVAPPSAVMVSFPGAYSATDPGIAFNIDAAPAFTTTAYPIPGPAVWDGTGNAPAPEPTPSAVPTTLVTSAAAKPTTPSCTPVGQYGQCGGKTYTGCTVCVTGTTCVASGDYYSQCF